MDRVLRRPLRPHVRGVSPSRAAAADQITVAASALTPPPPRSFFLQQNAAIAAGTVQGVPINLKVLGVGDGLTVSAGQRIYLLPRCVC